MQSQLQPIPAGYHSLTPYLSLPKAAEAIEFYKKAFGANELSRIDAPEGKIVHCELQIGDSKIMVSDEMGARKEEHGVFSLVLYVENVDDLFNRAVSAGAKVIRPLKVEYFGDRMGTVQDPFGNNWFLATHVEDVSPKEMKKRAEKMWH